MSNGANVEETEAYSTEDMLNIAPVSRLHEGIIQLKVFLLPDDRELIKRACQQEGITMTHLARVLLLQWAKEKLKDT